MSGLMKLPDNCISAIVTDPPYGIDFQSNHVDKDRRRPKILNDKTPFIWFLRDAFRVLKPGGTAHIFCRWDVAQDFRSALSWAGFTVKSEIVWDKQTHGMGDLKGAYAPAHETILFATKGRFTLPAKRPVSVISVPRVPPGALTHPNEKPVALMRKLIEDVTLPGDTVCDPFIGSGTTAVAALMCDRNVLGYELDPSYYKITVGRCALLGELAPFDWEVEGCNMTDRS